MPSVKLIRRLSDHSATAAVTVAGGTTGFSNCITHHKRLSMSNSALKGADIQHEQCGPNTQSVCWHRGEHQSLESVLPSAGLALRL